MAVKHRIAGRKLNRNTSQRKALFKGMINSLVMKEEIQTTAPKAKAIQGLVDKIINKSKLGTVHIRRLLHAFLGDKKVVNKLVDEMAPRMRQRQSGFTRIIKLGRRRGDDAQVVSMSFVDQAEAKAPEAKAAAKPEAKKQAKATKKK
jgi:large subunit ribosomal protein L17